MNRSAHVKRVLGLCFAFAACLVLLQALPASAQTQEGGGPAIVGAAVTAPVVPAACKLDLGALQKVGSCAAPTVDGNQPAAWVENAAGKKRGFCHCGCSSTPDCRTSADCGGSSCDAFISCC